MRPHLRQGYGGQGGSQTAGRGYGVARSAFTLLEVLVALAVFAMAAIVLAAAYVNVLNAYETVGRGNQTDEDVRFARAQLLAEPDHDTAEKGGDFTTVDGRHVSWHATIESTATADLFTVTFVCDLADAGGGVAQTVTENFTVMRPTWADPTEDTQLKQDAQNRIATLQGRTPQ